MEDDLTFPPSPQENLVLSGSIFDVFTSKPFGKWGFLWQKPEKLFVTRHCPDLSSCLYHTIKNVLFQNITCAKVKKAANFDSY